MRPPIHLGFAGFWTVLWLSSFCGNSITITTTTTARTTAFEAADLGQAKCFVFD